MIRALILLVFAGAAVFLIAPFMLTWWRLETHGVLIQGRIFHKNEYLKVIHSSWERVRTVTVEYPVPESGGVSFFDIHPDEQHYDALHTNRPAEVRYLLRRDLPKFPMTDVLWQLHALPVVRLANPQGDPAMSNLLNPTRLSQGALVGFSVFASLAILVLLWRVTRWRSFAWSAGLVALGVFGFLLLREFPRATVAPSTGVLRAFGRITNVERIDKLFSGTRHRGLRADQPVDAVAVEFIPKDWTEPVVAVDLIDHGSVAGLKKQSTAAILYEAGSPRIAYIEGAARTFPKRNLRGAVLQGILALAVLMGVWAAAQGIGKLFNRLVAR